METEQGTTPILQLGRWMLLGAEIAAKNEVIFDTSGWIHQRNSTFVSGLIGAALIGKYNSAEKAFLQFSSVEKSGLDEIYAFLSTEFNLPEKIVREIDDDETMMPYYTNGDWSSVLIMAESLSQGSYDGGLPALIMAESLSQGLQSSV